MLLYRFGMCLWLFIVCVCDGFGRLFFCLLIGWLMFFYGVYWLIGWWWFVW